MRIKFILIALLCVSLFFPPLNVSAAAPQTPLFQEADFVPGELIVIMKAGSSMSALSLPEKARASTKKRPGLEKLNAGVINVPAGQESAYIAQLKKQKDVLAVEPNYIVSADLYPNDPAYPLNQYGPALIQAESAWDTTIGSNSVIIAIIDSGLDASHPEFFGRTVAGYDFVYDDSVPEDEYGHGTHVAGIAAATGNNAQGIAGIAWGVRIMPLRMLDEYGRGDIADLAEALVWAADNGAKIINLSLGLGTSSTLWENAAYYAYSHGAAIFAAAGNNGINAMAYPARYDSVMAVGATDQTNNRASFSSYGATLDLMAPGVGIYSTLPITSGGYGILSGTSMAAPHAAGAAALLASLPCFDTPEKIYQALKDTALDLGAVGWDQEYGYGLIQIADAMLECPIITPTPFTVEYDLVNSENCSPLLVQYNWRDTSGGTPYVLANEHTYSSITLPVDFDFEFGGQGVTSPINGHANGFISMGNTNTEATEGNFRDNSPLPGGAQPNNFIAPFWDDLSFPATGVLYTRTFGNAPNREFVIEYGDFQRHGFSGSLNFEVVLFETTDEILFQYRALTGTGADGSSATVGLEYGNVFNGFAGYEYSYNQVGALQNGLALLFIPYASGSPTLPSNVCPQTQAVTIEAGISAACDGSPTPFDVDIAPGVLPYRSTLKIQQLTSAPIMPAAFLDLGQYADINLAYSPPNQLAPLPAVYVCYAYTPQDLLAAGGHPENLFIAAHNEFTNQWQPLATLVDPLSSRLVALAPHFSYYGVATLNPVSASPSGELGLPVTGGPLSREFLIFLVAGISMIFLLSGTWLRRKNR